VTYTYNAANQMTSESDWLSPQNTTDFSYDNDSNLNSEKLPNGDTSTSVFDNADLLDSISDAPTSTPQSPFATFTYGYQPNELLSSEQDFGVSAPSSQSYAYDAANRLTGSGSGSSTYDAADNATSIPGVPAQAYNADDQLCMSGPSTGSCSSVPSGASTYTYNQNGDRATQTSPLAPTSTYGYNQADELSQTGTAPPADQIGAGAASSVMVRPDGSVWAWGDNTYGELGNNSTTSTDSPVQVTGLSSVASVAAGYFSNYALSSGTVYAWGYNVDGELGNDSTTSSPVPVQVAGLSGVTAIAAGATHALAVTASGTVYSWGANGYGQLGNGTTTSSTTPVQVTGLSNVVAVAAGFYSSYALTSSGTVYAWGANSDGQLGDGNTTNSSTPVEVSSLSGVTQISAGAFHALALGVTGTVSAWGYGADGELGDGSTSNSSTPVEVSSLAGVTGIAAGGYHSVARGPNGALYSWGYNAYGQLGNGTKTNSSVPVAVTGINASVLGTGSTSGQSLVEQPDGSVYGWGLGTSGQVGDNAKADPVVPVLVSDIRSNLAAGEAMSLSLRPDGSVWAFGDNTFGELGNGTTTSSSVPVEVSGVSGASAVAAGYASSYALSSGNLYAWGFNGDGELGNNSTTSSSKPVQVPSLSGVTAVSAGVAHALALTSSGTVYAWGANSDGQLGNGTTTASKTPVEVTGLTNIVAISAGGYSSYALSSSGTVYSWGYNAYGGLGNNSTTNSSTPVQVSILSGVIQIAGQALGAVALTSSGAVYAWGYNADGELGNGTTTNSHTPVAVSNIGGVTSIAATGYDGFARSATGALVAWGFNTYGELGNVTTTSSDVPVTVSGIAVGSLASGSSAAQSISEQPDGVVSAWGYNGNGQLGINSTTNAKSPSAVLTLKANTPAQPAAYTYNGDGLRMTKTVGGDTHDFVWDSSNAIVSDGSNYYLYGPDGTPLEQISTGGTPLFFLHDQQGSTRLLTNSSGSVVGSFSYDAGGRFVSASGSASTPLGYDGAYTDLETGFLYLVNRYYDPTSAQFLSVDPAVNETALPYQYAIDDPVNISDPTGLGIFSWVGNQLGALLNGIGGAVSGNGSSWCANQAGAQREFACSGGVAVGDVWEGAAIVGALVEGARNPGGAVQDEEAVAAETPLTESEIPDVMQSIFSGCSQEGGNRNLLQLYKSGGVDKAETDFAKLTQGLSISKSANGVQSATLSSGANVSLRSFSSEQNLTTLQINVPVAPPIKIRYEY